MSIAAILSGVVKTSVIKLFGSLVTEKILVKVLAGLTISTLEYLVKSTKTTIDDNAVAPIIGKLKTYVG